LFDLFEPLHHRVIQRGSALGVKKPDRTIQVRGIVSEALQQESAVGKRY
jgi:hypothetical protein